MLTHQRAVAEGSTHRFRHELTTHASPEALWSAWIDVSSWPLWDTALEEAQLDTAFVVGAQGRLKSRGSPPSTFTIVRCEPGRAYAFASALPFGRLVVDRSMTVEGNHVSFTHDVRFEGLGGWLLGWLLGPCFRRALPDVMARLRAQIEGGA